jgi:hypothetical protein
MIYLFMSLGIEDLKCVDDIWGQSKNRKKVTNLFFKALLGCFSSWLPLLGNMLKISKNL